MGVSHSPFQIFLGVLQVLFPLVSVKTVILMSQSASLAEITGPAGTFFLCDNKVPLEACSSAEECCGGVGPRRDCTAITTS